MERNVPKKRKSSGQTPTLKSPAAPLRAAAGHGSAALLAGVAQSGAISRSLEVLSCVAQSQSALSLAQLAEILGLPKSTVHRICQQLTEKQFLNQGVREKEFAVGPKLRSLALHTLNNSTLRSIRHQVLADLVNHVGETCNLTTLDGAEVLYLDRVEARWPLRLTLEIGSRVPIHCTASGKLFLAMSSEATRQKILEHLGFERFTEKTIRSRSALLDELSVIRRQGYSIDAEEFIPGLIALAVPIHDARGEICAGLAIHAPTSRVPLKRIKEWLAPLQKTAKKLQTLI